MKKVSPFTGILLGAITGYHWKSLEAYFSDNEFFGIALFLLAYSGFLAWFEKVQPTSLGSK